MVSVSPAQEIDLVSSAKRLLEKNHIMPNYIYYLTIHSTYGSCCSGSLRKTKNQPKQLQTDSTCSAFLSSVAFESVLVKSFSCASSIDLSDNLIPVF